MGKAIITELVKDSPRFTITAITRQTSTYTAPSNTSVTHKTVDYTSLESLKDAFRGQDAIVNCITGGATQYLPSKLIIDAAIAAGVKFFFANEFVGHVTSERFKSLPESVAGAKFRIREYLEKVGRESKITWTSLNGGPFFDMCGCPPHLLSFLAKLPWICSNSAIRADKGPGRLLHIHSSSAHLR